MKKFLVKYTPLVLTLLIICIAILIAGLVFGIIRLINSINNDTVNIVLYSFIVFLDLLLVAFALSVLCYGRYVIDSDNLTFYLGFIKTKYSVFDIAEVNIFKKTNKLVIYFNNMKYTVVLISPKKYAEFITSLRESNKKIVYCEEKDEK